MTQFCWGEEEQLFLTYRATAQFTIVSLTTGWPLMKTGTSADHIDVAMGHSHSLGAQGSPLSSTRAQCQPSRARVGHPIWPFANLGSWKTLCAIPAFCLNFN